MPNQSSRVDNAKSNNNQKSASNRNSANRRVEPTNQSNTFESRNAMSGAINSASGMAHVGNNAASNNVVFTSSV
jgi:hypothetical protein